MESLIPGPALPEVAAPWTEETVKQCLYLYLALLPQNHKLIHELAAVYTEAIADIKRTVLRVIEQPVRPLSPPGCAHPLAGLSPQLQLFPRLSPPWHGLSPKGCHPGPATQWSVVVLVSPMFAGRDRRAQQFRA